MRSVRCPKCLVDQVPPSPDERGKFYCRACGQKLKAPPPPAQNRTVLAEWSGAGEEPGGGGADWETAAPAVRVRSLTEQTPEQRSEDPAEAESPAAPRGPSPLLLSLAGVGVLVCGIAVAFLATRWQAAPPRGLGNARGPQALTDDEATAWRKFRQHQIAAGGKGTWKVAGYLPAEGRWAVYDLDLQAGRYGWSATAWGLSYRDREESNFNLSVVGDQVGFWTRHVEAHRKRLAQAQEEAKADVARIGRVHPGTRTRLEMAEESLRKGEVILQEKRNQLAAEKAKPVKRISGLQEATEAARSGAAESVVKATVVLDMYGQPSPVAVRWYADDGSGVKALAGGPSKELEGKLAEFIRAYQARASRP